MYQTDLLPIDSDVAAPESPTAADAYVQVCLGNPSTAVVGWKDHSVDLANLVVVAACQDCYFVAQLAGFVVYM